MHCDMEGLRVNMKQGSSGGGVREGCRGIVRCADCSRRSRSQAQGLSGAIFYTKSSQISRPASFPGNCNSKKHTAVSTLTPRFKGYLRVL